MKCGLWAGVLFLMAVQFAQAAPVPDSERVAVDIRRTTIAVRDMQESLQLYRDTLGFKPIYDEMIRFPQEDGSERRMHLVLLRANDDFIGVLGLLHYVEPTIPERIQEGRHVGDAILLMNTNELEARFEQVRKLPTVKIVSEPHLVEYPSPDGPIRVMVSTFYDPNGVYVELNRLLRD